MMHALSAGGRAVASSVATDLTQLRKTTGISLVDANRNIREAQRRANSMLLSPGGGVGG